MKIYITEVIVVFKPGICYTKNECTSKTFSVIGENEDYLVIDDNTFTTIQKPHKYKPKEFNFYATLNRPSTNVKIGDNIFGTSCTYRMFSEKNPTKAAIKKAIKKTIEEKIGCIGKIDWSFL